MGSFLYHECDVCKLAAATRQDIPDNWFEFDYEFSLNKERKALSYLVCGLRCYTVMLSRCLEWSNQHSEVSIAGMSKSFVIELLNGVRIEKLTVDLDKTIDKNLEDRKGGIRQTTSIATKENRQLNKGKVTSIAIPSTDPLQWLEEFASNNVTEKTMDKMLSVYDNDNMVAFESLIDTDQPTIPLIRYRSHYSLFIHENLLPLFEQLKNKHYAPAYAE